VNTYRTGAKAPRPETEPGWTKIEIPANDGENPSFVSGEPNGHRLRVSYFVRESDKALCARAWFGPGAEGPPGFAHGGSIAAVLDEAMGFAVFTRGLPVLAAKLEVQFQKLLPTGTDATVEAWVDKVTGNKVTAKARLRDVTNECQFAEAVGIFIVQPIERFGLPDL